jgi:hypothetical protein
MHKYISSIYTIEIHYTYINYNISFVYMSPGPEKTQILTRENTLKKNVL